jgi:hypothetical protein
MEEKLMSKHHINGRNLFWFFLGCIVVAVLCIFVEWAKAEDFVQHDQMTLYTMYTDKAVDIAWESTTDPPIPDETFQFYLWNYGEQRKYAVGATALLTINIFLPRTGLWVFYCRAHIEYDKSSNWAEYQDYTLAQLVEEVNTNELLYETKKDLDITPTMTKAQILQSIQNYGFNSIYAQSDKIEFAQVKNPDTGLWVAGRWMIYGHVAPPTGGGIE